jgi:hypothetical protein
MEQSQATEYPPCVSHQRFVRAYAHVHFIEIVEEAEVVEDLVDDYGSSHGEGWQVNPSHPFASFLSERRLRAGKEWPDLHPRYNIVREVRAV